MTIDTSRVIEAITRSVPGTFVRDYREKGGEIMLCRGMIPITDDHSGHDHKVPDEVLMVLRRGFIHEEDEYSEMQVVEPKLIFDPVFKMNKFVERMKTVRVLKNPGWRTQFKKMRSKLTPTQRKKIEQELEMKVFS